MTSHVWCWSDIVNPRLVEEAMVEEAQRARRPLRGPSNDRAEDTNEHRPVAA